VPTIKLATNRITINTSGVTSSNVSSSLNGNINLIKSQIAQKTNDYINIKNAVNILEIYSNWNGYIKIYTEVQSNFVIGDTAYITYTSTLSGNTIFNLENPSVPDEGRNRFYLGYKILYINQSKNEIVINRHYNDIPTGYSLKNQQISKISCRGGYLYKSISDGAVFYNCNILNIGFSTISGIVSVGGVPISGVMITLSGTKKIHITDSNGYYILNAIKGENIIKSYMNGYIINTTSVLINSEDKITQNIPINQGENKITIYSDILPNLFDGKVSVCLNYYINFTSTTIGYSTNTTYQWYIIRNENEILVGTNNIKLSYNNFNMNDIVYCIVTDKDFNINSRSNNFTIDVLLSSVYIYADKTTITEDDIVTFTAVNQCYKNPSFQWTINAESVGTNNNEYKTKISKDSTVLCLMGNITSNPIKITIIQ